MTRSNSNIYADVQYTCILELVDADKVLARGVSLMGVFWKPCFKFGHPVMFV